MHIIHIIYNSLDQSLPPPTESRIANTGCSRIGKQNLLFLNCTIIFSKSLNVYLYFVVQHNFLQANSFLFIAYL